MSLIFSRDTKGVIKLRLCNNFLWIYLLLKINYWWRKGENCIIDGVIMLCIWCYTNIIRNLDSLYNGTNYWLMVLSMLQAILSIWRLAYIIWYALCNYVDVTFVIHVTLCVMSFSKWRCYFCYVYYKATMLLHVLCLLQSDDVTSVMYIIKRQCYFMCYAYYKVTVLLLLSLRHKT